ncbi:MAG: TIR domain-containing protein [Nostoc sp.]|uniref:TIR domain-containing protein n=1 Tax=Nostoc sp. TaxID=1180 RepID=UPI002FFCA9F6
MDDFRDSLDRIKSTCSKITAQFESFDVAESIKVLQEAANEAGKSWSGSWLGYHSRIYYDQLQPVPPGARFSQEWGFLDRYSNDNIGEWREYGFDYVYNALKSTSTSLSLEQLEKLANHIDEAIPDLREELISIIFSCLANREDEYLSRLKEEAEECKILSAKQFIDYLRPRGNFLSRDMVAMQSGLQTPPHIYLQAQLLAIQSPARAAENLKKLTNRLSLHLTNKSRAYIHSSQPGTHIFIGHGRSPLWRDLKDFISDRLKLPWDEFNRVPIAGITNITRLSQMLDNAAIAFLIMTAEDEQSDGKLRARMNVIHEAGLFQGRLGFTRAIILLEEGCENFSNVDGLGYIKFSPGNIKACFEEVRSVLEREGLA